jgi:CHC2 zinc finger/Reverse transcriptase (RNA-dependent DNA polymerase)/Toprim-like
MPPQSTNIDDVDIAEVAKKLGIQTASVRRRDRTLAICPFHKENTPSFALFGKAKSRHAHYHCFGCQAHGGVLDLIIQKGAASDYGGAIRWLREESFLAADAVRSDFRSKALTEADAIRGFLAAAQREADPDLLRTFAESRQFNPLVLSNAGVLAVDLDPIVRRMELKRDETRLLVRLGMIRRSDMSFLGEERRLPALSAFISGPRIVIPIRDINGSYVSAMARASRYDQEPKYKFPQGFERGRHLFGVHEVAAQLRGSGDSIEGRFFDVYLVEGVFDVLRLASVGHRAVACFGASITQLQVELIEQLAEIAAGQNCTLRLHLFFDMDQAGREGTARALARLMSSAADKGYLLDVVRPPGGTGASKEDPDSWIAKRQTGGETIDLAGITHPALNALIASYLDDSIAIEDVQTYWAKLNWPDKFAIGQRLGRRLKDIDYNRIKDIIHPDLTSLAVSAEASNISATTLGQELSALLTKTRETAGKDEKRSKKSSLFQPVERPPLSTRLQNAIELAFEACSSREYPVDVGSWERIRKTALIFVPLLEARLKEVDPPIRPFTAHYLSRSNGKPRLKCGPCPEDAILQQHFLAELLRFDGDVQRLGKIPAVRWWPDRKEMTTTGRGDPGGETVSFGYQIDMSALEGRPDRRSGRRDMFRPFIECWNAYIAYIGRRLSRMPGPVVHVARLDVRRFYDEIPRRVIHRKLDQALGKLLTYAPEFVEQLGFAPGDRGHSDTHETWKARIRDWVLAHSFGDPADGYRYIDPLDGQVRSWGRRGRGLPQGPPLSAYLATIALFDLDKRMVAEVAHLDRRVRQVEGWAETNAHRCGAVYARYVDDIILIATSEIELRHLLNCVSDEVNKAGLRLNGKTEVMLPKTIPEAREWLVERRGAGFAYDSGGIEDMPAPVQDVASSWADIPGLDRRHLLAMVLDPTLDDPDAFSLEAVLQRLKQAAGAGDELRESDLGFFARRLAMRLALDALSVNGARTKEGDGWRELAEEMARAWVEWLDLRPKRFELDAEDDEPEQVAHQALVNSGPLIALFDGVERMLAGKPELNPVYSDRTREKLKNARETFIRAVRNGLLDHLRDALEARLGGPRPVLTAQLVQQQIILEERADIAWRQAENKTGFEKSSRIGGRTFPDRLFPNATKLDADALWRLEASWHRTFNSASDDADGGAYPAIDECFRILRSVRAYSRQDWRREVPFALLHVGISLLGALGIPVAGRDLEKHDEEIKNYVTDELAQFDPGQPWASGYVAEDVVNVLMTWFDDAADDAIGERAGVIARAIFAFCMVLKGSEAFPALVVRRPKAISKLSDRPNAQLLPPPPLAGEWPLLFKDEKELIGVRIAIGDAASDGGPDDFLSDLNWSEPDKVADVPNDWTITRRTAKIGDFKFLLPPSDSCPEFDLSLTPWLVAELLDRAGKEHDHYPDKALLVTPYAILYRELRDSADRKVEVKLATWRAKASDVQGLAFRRSGRALVVQRTPYPAGDWIWRVGVAVADILGAVAAASDGPEDGEPENAGITRDPNRTQAALRRKLLSRIQGAYLPPTVHSADLEGGTLPRHIRRALDALIAAASEEGDGARATILQHFIEGRAMVLRGRVSPALESVPSGPAGVLARLGQECLKDRDEAFHEERIPLEEAFGRATDAYRRVAAMIDVLAGQAIRPDVSKGLQVAATGTRLWAMTVAWREFALALLARLDRPVRQSLLDMRPALGEWGLEGSAYLIDPRFGVKDADSADFDAPVQAEELCLTLGKALVAAREIDARLALDRVTLLGWVVVAGMATGTLPMVPPQGRERTPLPQSLSPTAAETVADILPALATILATGGSDGTGEEAADWPWDLFLNLVAQTPDREAETTLVKVAAATGIDWHRSTPIGKALTELEGHDGRFSYNPAGTASAFRPGYWRLAYTTLLREVKPRLESVLNDCAEEFQVWTTVRDLATGQPLVISVASNGLVLGSGLIQPLAPSRLGETALVAEGMNEPDAADIDLSPELGKEKHGGEAPLELAPLSTVSHPAAIETAHDGASNSVNTSAPAGGSAPPPDGSGTYQAEQDPPKRPDLSVNVAAALKAWKDAQKVAWNNRRFDTDNVLHRGYFRFAFLQTDFAEGYDDPKALTGHLKLPDSDRTTRDFCPEQLCWPVAGKSISKQPDATGGEDVTNPGQLKLCLDEWRRRKVLIDVVEACETFGVHVLLLPEYSMRAETVLWLAGYLEAKGSKISVWAGTFRVPSKFDVSVDRESMTGYFVAQGSAQITGREEWKSLEAVLPVIFRESVSQGVEGKNPEKLGSPMSDGSTGTATGWNGSADSETWFSKNRLANTLLHRGKRFPALAYEEIFRPPSVKSGLLPIMEHSRNLARAETYITELICSEIFAFNGPTNIRQIADNLLMLHRRINPGLDFKKTSDELVEQINNDNELFARFVSHGTKSVNLPRRTIIMLPCITKRAKDYHAFGTTLHLSAASNIIFCNSCLSGLGGGESCVIGFRSWDERANKSKLGPYHGVLPGLYFPSDGDGIKPLGPRERALVIVDIDPVNPALPQPRPQYVSEPVRLVAHLPVVEIMSGEVPGWNPGTTSDQEVASFVERATELAGRHDLFSTLDLAKPSNADVLKEAKGALKALYELYENSPALKKRAKEFKESYGGIPEAWPPPVLMDWLAVDLDVPGFIKCIDRLPGLERVADANGHAADPGLPLIWLEPPEHVAFET